MRLPRAQAMAAPTRPPPDTTTSYTVCAEALRPLREDSSPQRAAAMAASQRLRATRPAMLPAGTTTASCQESLPGQDQSLVQSLSAAAQTSAGNSVHQDGGPIRSQILASVGGMTLSVLGVMETNHVPTCSQSEAKASKKGAWPDPRGQQLSLSCHCYCFYLCLAEQMTVGMPAGASSSSECSRQVRSEGDRERSGQLFLARNPRKEKRNCLALPWRQGGRGVSRGVG